MIMLGHLTHLTLCIENCFQLASETHLNVPSVLNAHSKVTGFGEQSGQFLEGLLVLLSKSILFSTINVDDSSDLR